jgi:osmoprotectant transport system substrate-binding protein
MRRGPTRIVRPGRALHVLTAVALVGLLLTSCAGSSGPSSAAEDPARPTITVTSFDFPESEILGELYGQALRSRGYPVDVATRLGTREIVQAALEQGKVDFVAGYLGSGLNYMYEQQRVATADAQATHALLQQALDARGISALSWAPAQDRNGFVVTGDAARRRQLRTVSDLLPIAHELTFGGPPECPARPLCLRGLQEIYGLEFKAFEPQASRTDTANALEAGEIDVGMLETTDGNLAGRDLLQLEDDRALQPAENIVPLVRTEMIDRYGTGFVRVVDAVTSQLTAEDLVDMNSQVELRNVEPAAAAAGWLRSHATS